MPFWRAEFLLLLGLCLALLRFAPPALRKPVLTLTGLYFYAWWDIRFVPLLAGAALMDWLLGVRIQAATGRARLALFATGIGLHLGLLGFFKFAGFFLGGKGGAGVLLMPLGLSFQAFSAITYLAAVHAGRMPARGPADMLCFATFFPVLSAGPIVRAEDLLPQLDALGRPDAATLSDGFRRFSMGLFKKLVLADRLGLYVAEVYGNAGAYDAASTWAAVLAYALQIFLDFSGYTNMAVGAARALGIRLPENFDFPYASISPVEFWRRWHMSLSFWFRDHLYIPLGGSRGGQARTLANLLLVMLLCGVWHGSGWTFVAWGGLHGLGLCAHRLWRRLRPGGAVSPLGTAAAWAGTTLFVGLCWIPFRAADLAHAGRILGAMLGQGGVVHWVHPVVWLALGLTLLAHILRALGREDVLLLRGQGWHVPAATLTLALLALLFCTDGFTPFLYAQF